MEVLFFFLAFLLVLLALHPFSTYPLSLYWLNNLSRRSVKIHSNRLNQSSPSSYAVLMCAYNEAAVIEEKLNNLLSISSPNRNLEILVYNDYSSDATRAILDRYADRITVVHGSARAGKTHGMKTLVRMTSSEILIFTDANVMLSSDIVRRLAKYFRDPQIGLVCGTLKYTNGNESETASVGAAYWSLEETIKSLESDTGSVVGADGSIFAMRRALYPEVPDNIIDDFYVSLDVLCSGHRVVRAPDVRAWEKSSTDGKEEFSRKVRISCQAFNVHRMLWPRIARQGPAIAYRYVSHKLLRWITGPLLAAGGLFALLGLVSSRGLATAVGVCVTGLVVLALLRVIRPSLLKRIFEVGRAFVAISVGIWRSLSGDQFQIWTPPASVRTPSANR
ncbi:glycosyltransferase family 2 protein (plasmid) [Skermanella sp. TT6]|uniref:Glycosyltransferase family 2 protein n=1 Tax=Skermanella cutis TaxID=2775420 RepID=A0ABX7BF26_9PROT|nr:glycosyltransferase family 2 protein [Skermanella sp. TT6]QQP92749.1 glycosyltransferase family 2 protein [Skermanella sp. TT6]